MMECFLEFYKVNLLKLNFQARFIQGTSRYSNSLYGSDLFLTIKFKTRSV